MGSPVGTTRSDRVQNRRLSKSVQRPVGSPARFSYSLQAVIGDILQPTHLLFVLVIALLVLGPKRLPEVGRSLGKGIRDFRNALSTEDHERVESGPVRTSAEPAQPAAAQPVTAQPVNEPAEHVS